MPAAAVDGAVELDMVRVGRETLTPESLITMASRRVQGRGRGGESEKRSAAQLFGGQAGGLVVGREIERPRSAIGWRGGLAGGGRGSIVLAGEGEIRGKRSIIKT